MLSTSDTATGFRLQKFMLERCLSKLQKGNPGGRELAGVGHLLKMQAALQHMKSKQPGSLLVIQSIGVEGVPNKRIVASEECLFPVAVS